MDYPFAKVKVDLTRTLVPPTYNPAATGKWTLTTQATGFTLQDAAATVFTRWASVQHVTCIAIPPMTFNPPNTQTVYQASITCVDYQTFGGITFDSQADMDAFLSASRM